IDFQQGSFPRYSQSLEIDDTYLIEVRQVRSESGHRDQVRIFGKQILDNVSFQNARFEAFYPENFVFTSSSGKQSLPRTSNGIEVTRLARKCAQVFLDAYWGRV